MRQLKIDHVNLALKPAFREQGEEYLAAVGRQDWTITATTIGFFQEDYTSLARIRATGGIVPDEHWPENRRMVERAAEITAAMGVGHLTMHAGFLESGDAEEQKKVRDRLGWLADAAARLGIGLLLEELDHPALGVNFDPANMILYGKGDPLAAARLLGRWIKHIHVKDAVAAERPGEWGREVPWGDGQVGGETFLESLKEIGFAGALAIEREAGRDRLGDIGRAAERLAGWQAP